MPTETKPETASPLTPVGQLIGIFGSFFLASLVLYFAYGVILRGVFFPSLPDLGYGQMMLAVLGLSSLRSIIFGYK